MRVTAIIPARYKSTRFTGKPLAEICGKPMIQHVYQQTKMVEGMDQVIVATDDQRIYRAVEKFDGEVTMTSSQHRSGTDRIAEVAGSLDTDLIVNVQGDEPLIKPEMIERAMEPFTDEPELEMSTLRKKINNLGEIKNPNVVKVVTDKKNYALYFSRSPIPYQREGNPEYYKHIGLYVFRRDFLLKYSQLNPTPLEKAESLEQLRALENGHKIKVVETDYEVIGVDQPQDIEKVEKILKNK
ncbi:MAG: 3-deoxy-manno-octulosonate cytidylyltransferase [Halanaerobiales bacterium]